MGACSLDDVGDCDWNDEPADISFGMEEAAGQADRFLGRGIGNEGGQGSSFANKPAYKKESRIWHPCSD